MGNRDPRDPDRWVSLDWLDIVLLIFFPLLTKILSFIALQSSNCLTGPLATVTTNSVGSTPDAHSLSHSLSQVMVGSEWSESVGSVEMAELNGPGR